MLPGPCFFFLFLIIGTNRGGEGAIFLSLSLSWWVWWYLCTARSTYKSGDAPVTAASLDSGLSGSAYSLLDEEAEANEVDSAIFQVPRLWVNLFIPQRAFFFSILNMLICLTIPHCTKDIVYYIVICYALKFFFSLPQWKDPKWHRCDKIIIGTQWHWRLGMYLLYSKCFLCVFLVYSLQHSWHDYLRVQLANGSWSLHDQHLN